MCHRVSARVARRRQSKMEIAARCLSTADCIKACGSHGFNEERSSASRDFEFQPLHVGPRDVRGLRPAATEHTVTRPCVLLLLGSQLLPICWPDTPIERVAEGERSQP